MTYKRGREGPGLVVPAWVRDQLRPGELAAVNDYGQWYAVPASSPRCETCDCPRERRALTEPRKPRRKP